MGGMGPRDPYVVSRKPSPARDTKNSLLQADSTRETIHTTHHYRHSNRWKMRQAEKMSAPRRWHESRLFVEANKYWAAHWLADQDCLIYIRENLRSDCQIRWWNVRSRCQEPTNAAPRETRLEARASIDRNEQKLAGSPRVSCSLGYTRTHTHTHTYTQKYTDTHTTNRISLYGRQATTKILRSLEDVETERTELQEDSLVG